MQNFLYRTFILMFVCFVPINLFAQKRTVAGLVQDKTSQEPLIGVTVME